MKKYIKAEDLPEILDEETIEILANMANEIPQSDEWHRIFDVLSYENLTKVMDKRLTIQEWETELRKSQMTEAEKLEETRKMHAFKKEIEQNPHVFFGNMGQPETPQEFKNRYGVWPPGYDENGNKI